MIKKIFRWISGDWWKVLDDGEHNSHYAIYHPYKWISGKPYENLRQVQNICDWLNNHPKLDERDYHRQKEETEKWTSHVAKIATENYNRAVREGKLPEVP